MKRRVVKEKTKCQRKSSGKLIFPYKCPATYLPVSSNWNFSTSEITKSAQLNLYPCGYQHKKYYRCLLQKYFCTKMVHSHRTHIHRQFIDRKAEDTFQNPCKSRKDQIRSIDVNIWLRSSLRSSLTLRIFTQPGSGDTN